MHRVLAVREAFFWFRQPARSFRGGRKLVSLLTGLYLLSDRIISMHDPSSCFQIDSTYPPTISARLVGIESKLAYRGSVEVL